MNRNRLLLIGVIATWLAACSGSTGDESGTGGHAASNGGTGGSVSGSGGKASGGFAGSSGSAGSDAGAGTGATGGSAASGGTGALDASSGGSAGAAGTPVSSCGDDGGIAAPKLGPNGDCYVCKQALELEPCVMPPGLCGYDSSMPTQSTKSAHKFFDVVECMCVTCATECGDCATDPPIPNCQACVEAKCTAELAACKSDDGT